MRVRVTGRYVLATGTPHRHFRRRRPAGSPCAYGEDPFRFCQPLTSYAPTAATSGCRQIRALRTRSRCIAGVSTRHRQLASPGLLCQLALGDIMIRPPSYESASHAAKRGKTNDTSGAECACRDASDFSASVSPVDFELTCPRPTHLACRTCREQAQFNAFKRCTFRMDSPHDKPCYQNQSL